MNKEINLEELTEIALDVIRNKYKDSDKIKKEVSLECNKKEILYCLKEILHLVKDWRKNIKVNSANTYFPEGNYKISSVKGIQDPFGDWYITPIKYLEHIQFNERKQLLRDKYIKILNKYSLSEKLKLYIRNRFVREMDILLSRKPIQMTRDYIDGELPIEVKYRDWQLNLINNNKY